MDTIQLASSVRVGRNIQGSIACVTTSLTNLDNDDIGFLSPNPVSDILNVHYLSKVVQLQVTNIIGEEIPLENIMTYTTDGFKLDLSELSKGIYFLNITSGNKKTSKKFIKQ